MKLNLLLIILTFSFTQHAIAAQKIKLNSLEQINEVNQKLSQRNVSAMTQVQALVNTLGLDKLSSLRQLRENTDNGIVFQRYQQLYQGIPVWGEHVIVGREEINPSQVARLSGAVIKGLTTDLGTTRIKPSFDAKAALALAKATPRSRAAGEMVYEDEKSELHIYIDANGKARLAYVVTYFADKQGGGTPVRPTVIIDARTKKVLKQFNALTTGKATGPGGNTKTGKYEYGVDYDSMDVKQVGNKCTMQSLNVTAVNLNHKTSGTTAYEFTCPKNTTKQINGAFSPLNDAYYFGGVVFGMYKDWFNTAPLTFSLTMRVHYSSSYENAFWDGKAMTFGDGKNSFYPLVSLDVSAHEVSHGFTEQNSGLIYEEESGGLNEAFSDMAGEAAEYYMKGKNDYLIGADIMKAEPALRYMEDPTKDGHSVGHFKDYDKTLQTDPWTGTTYHEVHWTSGIFNRAFFLLATTAGWDIKKAFAVFVKANQNYWTPSTTFKDAAKGAVSAAGDLGYNKTDVENALKAVGVL